MSLLTRETLLDSLRVRRGLTLIEVLVLFSIAALTILGAAILHRFVDGLLGWLLGALGGCLSLPVVAGTCFLFLALAKEGIPMVPRCRNGCCRGADYEIDRFGEEFYWVCKCGDRYSRRGRRFLQVTDAGEKVPFRIWRPFRGWFLDEDRP